MPWWPENTSIDCRPPEWHPGGCPGQGQEGPMNTIDGIENNVDYDENAYVHGDPRVSFWDVLATIALIVAISTSTYIALQYWILTSSTSQFDDQVQKWAQEKHGWNLLLWMAAAVASFLACRTSDVHDKDTRDSDRPEDGGTMLYLFLLSLVMTILSFIALFV